MRQDGMWMMDMILRWMKACGLLMITDELFSLTLELYAYVSRLLKNRDGRTVDLSKIIQTNYEDK